MSYDFTPKWSEAQKTFICQAVLDHGRELPEVLADIAVGEPGGEAVEIPYRTAWGYVNAERRRRATTRTHRELLAEAAEQGLARVHAELAEFEAQTERGEAINMAAFSRTIKLGTRLDAQLRALTAAPSSPPQADDDDKPLVTGVADPPTARDFVDEVLARDATAAPSAKPDAAQEREAPRETPPVVPATAAMDRALDIGEEARARAQRENDKGRRQGLSQHEDPDKAARLAAAQALLRTPQKSG